MINKNKIYLGILFLLSVFFIGNVIMKKDLYYLFLFNQLCKEKSLYSVNTHNIENVNNWYRLLFKNGKKINPFLEKQFLNKEKTAIIFNGLALKKSDVSIFLYIDINYDDIAMNNVMQQYNIDNMNVFWVEIMQNEFLKKDFINTLKNFEALDSN
ncbi:hypothetical protein [Breznakiella homolactica]|uniref:Uncharacterized protein n=1 Tax=Breznakiella homolactica TaxID=2798577 RepID=A0A7T8BCY4_9SPIR|nr:hypothetical protein [Breznakiella homolactica]QQO10713.1 hypothetical protein JFL75_07310 [Breznakiella homolactica]